MALFASELFIFILPTKHVRSVAYTHTHTHDKIKVFPNVISSFSPKDESLSMCQT